MRWPALSYDPTDPRQLQMFPDEVDDRREILVQIDGLIRQICGSNRNRIIALNAKLRAHYHPTTPRSACSVAMLRSILAGLQAEQLSVAV